MAEKEGYVKAFRTLMKWRWYTNGNTLRVFLHCLLCANWVDGYIGEHCIPKGSFLTSYGRISEETGLTLKEVRNAIDNLKKTK